MKIKHLIWILVFIALATNTLAIGIAPAKTTIAFEPDLQKEIDLLILNNNREDLTVMLQASGELANYITFSQDVVKLSPDTSKKTVKYYLNLPKDLNRRGAVEAMIIAKQVPNDQGSQIQVTTSVASRLIVNIPYVGKFLEATPAIMAKLPEQGVGFTISLTNLGDEDIKYVQAAIEIVGPTNEVIDRLETNAISIDRMMQSKIYAKYDKPLAPGRYGVVITLKYDGIEKQLMDVFEVREKSLDILSISTDDFRLGEIAQLGIFVYNNWNEIMKDVYAEAVIRDKLDKIAGTFKTVSQDIGPRSYGTLLGYWDTKDVGIGLYEVDLSLHYDDKTTESTFDLLVQQDKITSGIGRTTGQVISAEGNESNTLLLSIVALLVIINTAVIFYLVRTLKKRKEK